ncbi:hypothetical protein EZV62_007958 [Acer yangbiense]|uniref:Uncharacterized protein n=1 Tax=Acer yangbiense TaxID=1000413 RepID=A0A5C7IB79_9ROSI|nr:hypothetical protein EZV62_007958 [Acer yangbiense]
MSVERSFEAWEEVQRHGQDLADRLAQGFSGLIQSHMTNPPSFPWPNPSKSKLFDLELPIPSSTRRDFPISINKLDINGVSAIFDIGNRIGQAGADFGAGLNGLVQQLFRQLPVPFKHEESVVRVELNRSSDVGVIVEEGFGVRERERLRGLEAWESDSSNGLEGSGEEEIGALDLRSAAHLGRPQVICSFYAYLVSVTALLSYSCLQQRLRSMIFWSSDFIQIASAATRMQIPSVNFCPISEKGILNITSTYDSRTRDLESSLVARGDLWRVEASNGSSTSGNDNSSLFLVQLGPVLFVRDSTLLLPVHLSKQHLLWYGYDRKNGMHSLCPAVWSKHRRWLLMSMLCLNPLACSFVDLQFPNGQLTYVSGEGLTTSAFLPLCGGLLQAQGQYPGEMRFSFSCKNKWGTRMTPMVQWPDKSFTLGLAQALAWKRSGLMVRPTIQFSLCPTFGGSNPGMRAELIHSLKEELSLIYGYTFMTHPSAFASVSFGRSKWNGNVGSSGMVMRVDAPLSRVGRPSFSVQINTGIEF